MLANLFIIFCDLVKERKRKKDDYDIAMGMDYGVASFLS